MKDEQDEAIDYPLDGTLDLHMFRPRDAREVTRAYLEACRERGILEVRIVHGKGQGVLARSIRGLLEELPYVIRVRPGGETGGGWGATVVDLLPAAGATGD